MTSGLADVAKVRQVLKRCYPQAKCELDFKNPLQLLVATVLSAQCTDKRVNQVTPALFQKYRSAADFAAADLQRMFTGAKTADFEIVHYEEMGTGLVEPETLWMTDL